MGTSFDINSWEHSYRIYIYIQNTHIYIYIQNVYIYIIILVGGLEQFLVFHSVGNNHPN